MCIAAIGKIGPDGAVTTITLHFAGFPEHAGIVLFKHYSSRQIVERLLLNGDMRDLSVTFETSRRYGPGAKRYRSIKDAFDETGAWYAYLWDNDQWTVSHFSAPVDRLLLMHALQIRRII